jgi:hypothetical protein
MCDRLYFSLLMLFAARVSTRGNVRFAGLEVSVELTYRPKVNVLLHLGVALISNDRSTIHGTLLFLINFDTCSHTARRRSRVEE